MVADSHYIQATGSKFFNKTWGEMNSPKFMKNHSQLELKLRKCVTNRKVKNRNSKQMSVYRGESRA